MSAAVRKVVCQEFAPLDRLVIEEAPDLEPGPGQVVVDIEAAGANFVDALLVQGLYQIKPPLPFTPGMQVAGTVSSVGAGVTGVAVGERVLATSFFGGYATQTVLPEAGVVPVHISREQFNYWSHTHITIDVVPGRGAGFSIEGPTGNRFIIRSRIFTDEEAERMDAEPPR